MEGYIKLYRQLMDWEWYQDGNTFRVFMHLLLLANYQDHKFRGLDIKRGQVLTSHKNISSDLKLSVKNVRTAINHLKETGEVASKPAGGGVLITIENFEKYQGGPLISGEWSVTANGEQVASKWRAGGEQVATYNKDNKDNKDKKENNYKRESRERDQSEISDIELRKRLLAGCKDHIVPDALSDMHRLWIESLNGDRS